MLFWGCTTSSQTGVVTLSRLLPAPAAPESQLVDIFFQSGGCGPNDDGPEICEERNPTRMDLTERGSSSPVWDRRSSFSRILGGPIALSSPTGLILEGQGATPGLSQPSRWRRRSLIVDLPSCPWHLGPFVWLFVAWRCDGQGLNKCAEDRPFRYYVGT